MRHLQTLLLALLLLGAGAVPGAQAQGPAPGNCTLGTAERDLDVNNVLARVFNTGSLFFGNTTVNGDGYLVPQSSGNSPIFASGIWIAGEVNGQLHAAGATYDNFEFWPGPLDSNGNPPANCSDYDRIFSVGKQDIQDYESTGNASRDLAEWPAELGAPVIAAPGNGFDDDGDGLIDEGTDEIDNDGDGFVDERDEQERVDNDVRQAAGMSIYDLAAGDRPEIIGDQGIWWVMNDVGNVHNRTTTDPIGVEVQVLAWSFARSDALGDVTFYRYRVINKGNLTLENTYLSIFSDPDLGNAVDDYVGVDTTLSLGFVYNGAAQDANYGTPPALGYDFFQGPIVDADGDGAQDDTLGTTRFMYFSNANSGPTIDPQTGEAMYFFMQGLWGDGTVMREGGDGYGNQPGPVTVFAYPGDPVSDQFWSEVNIDGSGTDNPVGDRRFLVSTGPFVFAPGDVQDIVFGVVFAQGTSNLASITALRAADATAQTAYDIDFELAAPPPPPPACVDPDLVTPDTNPQLMPGSGSCFEAVELNNQVTLVWGYPTTSENYLGRFEEFDRLLASQDVPDKTYNFQGFNIYRYPDSGFSTDERELVATFDIVDGVTTVVDEVFDPEQGILRPTIVARGTDSGIQYTFNITGLTNFTDYFYGITAYSHNEFSTPKVIESSATNIVVRPSRIDPTAGGSTTQSTFGDSLAVTTVTQIGDGGVSAVVVDPTAITGDTYRVEFFANPDGTTNYNIVDVTTGEIAFNGEAFFAQTGESLPQRENVVVVDGISFSLSAPTPGPTLIDPAAGAETLSNLAFVEVTAPGGGPACTDGDTSPGCAEVGGDVIYQSFNSTGVYVGYHGGAEGPETSIGAYTPRDYEIRFTAEGSLAYHAFSTGRISRVPFEVWDIGVVPPGTANDPSDDIQMVAAINSVAGTDEAAECTFDFGDGPTIFGLGTTTDWIYAYYPVDDDYAAWEAAAEATNPETCPVDPATADAAALIDFDRGRPLQRFLMEDGGAGSVTALEGAVIRFYTVDPLQPGSEFTVSTAGFELVSDSTGIAEESLDLIAVVPNPYMGRSAYESGNLDRVVRFTNLPEVATIRIYTIAGSLVKTLRKDGSSRSLDWNLETENNLPIASGMYLIHVEVPGVGERVLKFGVVNRQNQITVF